MNLSSLFAATNLGKDIPHVAATTATLNSILGILYVLAGALAVVFIIVGGIRYTLSGGESAKITQAKNTILYAIVGLVIVLLAFTITNFVLGSVDLSSWPNLRDKVINTLIYVAGALAVIMLIFGGFRYASSGGNSSSVTQGKNTILYAVVGLVIAVLAYAIVNYVIGKF